MSISSGNSLDRLHWSSEASGRFWAVCGFVFPFVAKLNIYPTVEISQRFTVRAFYSGECRMRWPICESQAIPRYLNGLGPSNGLYDFAFRKWSGSTRNCYRLWTVCGFTIPFMVDLFGFERFRDLAFGSYLVDPASSHMLVSKIKPCMSKYKQLYGETANGSLNQL